MNTGNGPTPLAGTVHIVDEEDRIRRSLSFLIGTAGYVVRSWTDGETFLDKANRNERSCVLLDLMIPDANGLDVIREMGRQGWYAPVIALTEENTACCAAQTLAAGAMDVLCTPCDRDRLLKAVSRALQLNDDRNALRRYQLRARAKMNCLSAREYAVLYASMRGHPSSTVANLLRLSRQSVDLCRAIIINKLGVSTFADAVRTAFAAGLASDFTENPAGRMNAGWPSDRQDTDAGSAIAI